MIHKMTISAEPIVDPFYGLKLRWRILINDEEVCFDYLMRQEDLVTRSAFDYICEIARQKLGQAIFERNPIK